MPRPAVILVIDGLGIGAMPDCGPNDAGSDTLGNVLSGIPGLHLPNLTRLGLLNAANRADGRPDASWGRAALGYPGADTYLGHRELMGRSTEGIRLHPLADFRGEVIDALAAAGHSVRPAKEGTSALLVDERVVVADNVEAALGLNINATASLDEIEFDEVVRIAEIVRSIVRVPRVIAVGGRGYTTDEIIGSLKQRGPGHIGVDTPGLGVYDEHYQVRHLGAGGADNWNLPDAAIDAGWPVALLGKAADVIECRHADRDNAIASLAVIEGVLGRLRSGFDGLVVANIQETDLAGHEQDVARFGRTLADIDATMPALLDAVGNGLLIVTADHGNDPTRGDSRHTREYVPVLAWRRDQPPRPLGLRSSLGDVAATVAELGNFSVGASGLSFAPAIQPEASRLSA
jgi:phosphopentomutase